MSLKELKPNFDTLCHTWLCLHSCFKDQHIKVNILSLSQVMLTFIYIFLVNHVLKLSFSETNTCKYPLPKWPLSGILNCRQEMGAIGQRTNREDKYYMHITEQFLEEFVTLGHFFTPAFFFHLVRNTHYFLKDLTQNQRKTHSNKALQPFEFNTHPSFVY